MEKNIRRLRWAGLPLEFWKRSGLVLVLSIVMVMSGSFLYYETRWRGSPEMVTFLVNGIIVCAFLMVVENIFLINNKMEILKANIKDYLENLSLPPQKASLAPEDLKDFKNLREQLSGQSRKKQVTEEVAVSADEDIGDEKRRD